MKYLINVSLFCFFMTFCCDMYGVGFIITAPHASGPVSIEFDLALGGKSGGILLPGEILKIDTLTIDVQKIRWVVGCAVYELDQIISGFYGWKTFAIQDGECLIGSSGILDSIVGEYIATNIWKK